MCKISRNYLQYSRWMKLRDNQNKTSNGEQNMVPYITWYMSNKIPAKFVEVSYTSLEIMWESWFLGPFNAKNEPIMHPQPSVKQMANFWGTKTMAGRKIVKAMNTRKMPLVNKRPKYINDLPDGTLLVADWKLPGSSLTPFVTLHYVKNK